MSKLLILNPNTDVFGRQSIPTALISALLKKNNHVVELFDTTFMDLNSFFPEKREELTKKFNEFKFFKEPDYSVQDFEKTVLEVPRVFNEKIQSYQPDFIAFSFWGSHLHAEGEYLAYHKALRIIEASDIGDIPVFVGGTVPTSNVEMVLEHTKIKYVVKGEGELVYLDIANKLDSGESLQEIPNLCFDKGDGNIVTNDLRPLIEPLDTLPHADFSIYDDRLFYRPYHGNLVRCIDYELSRGCIYNCTFCLSPFQREQYGTDRGQPGHPGKFRREKSVDKIIDEITYLKERHSLDMIRYQDETFLTMRPKKLRELAEKYREHVNLPFMIEATINGITEDKIESLKIMGCASIGFGLESGSQRVRDKIIDKPYYTNEQVKKNLMIVKKSGISFMLYNIIGFPGETEDDVLETIKLNNSVKPPYCSMSFLQPWEGTAIRKSAMEQGNLGYDFSETEGLLFQQRVSPLKNLDISEKALTHYHGKFTYYVYLNRFLWPLIRFAGEKNIMRRFVQRILDRRLVKSLNRYRS